MPSRGDDLQAALQPVAGQVADDRPVLDPRVLGSPLTRREGTSFDVVVSPPQPCTPRRSPPTTRLWTGSVVLDFDAFDTWYEEDEPLVGHPRDPYHRVDVRRSSRHVRIELDGLCARRELPRPSLVFETSLPTRFYLPWQGPTGRAAAE